jgi:8-oxo-dGTP pyrophosphatase MutT (NUDIX family)
VEFGEPVPVAARREAAEESGCDPGELTLTSLLTSEAFRIPTPAGT